MQIFGCDTETTVELQKAAARLQEILPAIIEREMKPYKVTVQDCTCESVAVYGEYPLLFNNMKLCVFAKESE
jgi:hypothetical protein